jgi:outer membrane immunogenic protein
MEADIQGVTSNSGSRIAATAVPLSDDGWWAPGTVLTSAASASSRLDYIGTVRGRLGWLVTPTLLLYGTGGLAFGGVSANLAYAQWNNSTDFYPDNTFGPAFGSANFSNTQVGWTAGGGLEWMFLPNWSAKVEYLYYDLGSIRVSSAMPASYSVAAIPDFAPAFSGVWATTLTTASMRFNGNIVRAGVNYHFNWGAPAPVVAKY